MTEMTLTYFVFLKNKNNNGKELQMTDKWQLTNNDTKTILAYNDNNRISNIAAISTDLPLQITKKTGKNKTKSLKTFYHIY